ncbi:NAD-dependent succinate-semialdehyde dehydrogenase [Caenimonas sedimenti]|uniref:4-(hydroxymethyl)benzenesulfonate dehydrogenase n=1 Tax=Caenimonas sedimenti TaxID=2596921 RepID=A0A562ZXB0_9BURK|nr:NAD-dependent succinate-semialdehyde dehydrogenase [Caenimonas sedimenti]
MPLLHIAGRWRAGRHERRHTVFDPSCGQPIGELGLANGADIDEALAAAESGFAAWRQVPAFKRGEALLAAARRLQQRGEEIATLLTREQGKPLAEARSEIAGTVQVIQWYAEESRRSYGRIIPPRVPGSALQVLREPVGPCAAFSPWNFPLMLSSRKIAGALAAGCSVVLKAAEETPASVAAMVDCFLASGLPDGALQLLYGVPEEVSRRLLGSPIIRKLSFTGSVPVGRELARLAADQLQRVTLELGGHAPVLVFADANLDAAVVQLAGAKFRNAGQICAAPTRFLVERSVHDAFLERMAAACEQLRLGPGLAPGSTLGPLASARRQAAMQPLVDDALANGARLVVGGTRPEGQGFFYRPTLLADVPTQARAMGTEPFGPLVLTRPFDTEAEAIAVANGTRMGLAAYLYTDSASRQARLVPALRTGMVAINHASVSSPEAPFGGVGDSGYGSECGVEGLDAYLQPKFVHQFPAFDGTPPRISP